MHKIIKIEKCTTVEEHEKTSSDISKLKQMQVFKEIHHLINMNSTSTTGQIEGLITTHHKKKYIYKKKGRK